METVPSYVQDRAKSMVRARLECLWEHRNYFESLEAQHRAYQPHGSDNVEPIMPSYFRLDDLPKSKAGKLSGQIYKVSNGSQIKFSTAFTKNTQASKYFQFMRGYITKNGQIIVTTRKQSCHPVIRRVDYTLRKNCKSIADVRSLCAEIYMEHNKYADNDAFRIGAYMEIKPYLELPTGANNFGDLLKEVLSEGLWDDDDFVHSGVDWWPDALLDSCIKHVRARMAKDVNYWLDKAYGFKSDIIERGAGGAK